MRGGIVALAALPGAASQDLFLAMLRRDDSDGAVPAELAASCDSYCRATGCTWTSLTCNHSAIFSLSFLGLDPEMATK